MVVKAQQPFSYPVVSATPKSVDALIPKDWVVVDSGRGDLNRDGRSDLALVLLYKDSVKLYYRKKGFADSITTRPRMLLVLFATKQKNQYVLAAQSNTVYPPFANIPDPHPVNYVHDVYIEKGQLELQFMDASWAYDMGAGYTFRYVKGKFRLVKAVKGTIIGDSDDFEDLDFYFEKRNWTRETDRTWDFKHANTVWHKLKLKRLRTLDEMREPLNWEVVKGVYL